MAVPAFSLVGDGKHLRWYAWSHGAVRAAFTLRYGGASVAPYDHLNLGLHVGDDAAVVVANRHAIAAALSLPVEVVRTVTQVHGTGVWVDGESADAGMWSDGRMPPIEADALVTDRGRGHAPAVLTADCMPIVLAGPERMAVVHAGWRGLVDGVVERALDVLGDLRGVRAAVGPSIGPCCFEVGEDVAARFSPASVLDSSDGRLLVDARRELVARLASHGVMTDVLDVCTSCDADLFSHRRTTRAGGVSTGRQAAIAWFTAQA